MTFVCAECRLTGRNPKDCVVCIKVRAALKDAPPYEPPEVMPPQPVWQQPEHHWIVEEDERELRQEIARKAREAYAKEDEWWDHLREVRTDVYEGHGDPQLSYECFNDFTYSPELRAKMREQVSLEIFSMPDDEWHTRIYAKAGNPWGNRKRQKDF